MQFKHVYTYKNQITIFDRCHLNHVVGNSNGYFWTKFYKIAKNFLIKEIILILWELTY